MDPNALDATFKALDQVVSGVTPKLTREFVEHLERQGFTVVQRATDF